MSYYQLLRMQKDPFSNSPDPLFLYNSRECYNYLSNLEIAIRLRRGLNVLVGDIGTGKTTIGRALLKLFEGEAENFIFHLILDPSFESEMEFLTFLLRTFSIPLPKESSPVAYKNAIQNFLLDKGVKENKTIVLVIDEAQKLKPPGLEILREMLNFETNDCKLLQLVLLGQMDLLESIRQQPNLMDRVNGCFILHPLNRAETEAMINYRLAVAGSEKSSKLFTPAAINAIHRATRGYPRKIVFLCHHALIAMLIQKKNLIDRSIIHNVVRMRSNLRKKTTRFLSRRASRAFLAVPVVSCLAAFLLFFSLRSPSLLPLPQVQAPHLKEKKAHQVASITNTSVSYPSSSANSTPKLDSAASDIHNTSPLAEQIKTTQQQMDIASASHPAQTQKELPKARVANEHSAHYTSSPETSESAKLLLPQHLSEKEKLSQDIVWVVKWGDTLYALARRVYGRADHDLLRMIQNYNPEIKDVNNLRAGQIVRFPEITSKPSGKKDSRHKAQPEGS